MGFALFWLNGEDFLALLARRRRKNLSLTSHYLGVLQGIGELAYASSAINVMTVIGMNRFTVIFEIFHITKMSNRDILTL
jgi:hypothetical protein